MRQELHEDLRRQLVAADIRNIEQMGEADLEACARLLADKPCKALLGDIERVKSALLRTSSGRFGTCLACGEEIELNLLRADPSIAYCVRCSQRQQHRTAHF